MFMKITHVINWNIEVNKYFKSTNHERFFNLKNTRYDLRNKLLMKLPETSTSRYGTQALCSKGSLILNMVPNKFKNLDKVEDFKQST